MIIIARKEAVFLICFLLKQIFFNPPILSFQLLQSQVYY